MHHLKLIAMDGKKKYVINQFFHDMLREERGGKFSSKKFWGHMCMIAVVGSFVLDGLHFYTISPTLFGYLLTAGCTLLGLKIAKDIVAKWKGTPTSTTNE